MSGSQGRTRTGTPVKVEDFGVPCVYHSATWVGTIKIRHLRQFLLIASQGENSLSTYDLSLNVCQCGPNV